MARHQLTRRITRTRHTLAAVTITMTLAGAFSGCAAGPGTPGAANDEAGVEDSAQFTPGEISPGIDESVVPQFVTADFGAAWSPEAGVLWVFTAGSSSCPMRASSPATGDAQGVAIALGLLQDGASVCTADYAWHTTKVVMPDGADAGTPLTVQFTSESGEPASLVVPPRTTPGATGPAAWGQPWNPASPLDADSLIPQAGGWAPGIPQSVDIPQDASVSYRAGAAWAGTDGLLYVFTWGSSSCPAIAEPNATGDTSGVSVTFRPQAPDAPCTRDYAPTTSVVAVPGGTDSGEPLNVQLGDLGSVVVEPRGGEYEPGVTHVVGPGAWLS